MHYIMHFFKHPTHFEDTILIAALTVTKFPKCNAMIGRYVLRFYVKSALHFLKLENNFFGYVGGLYWAASGQIRYYFFLKPL